MFSTLKVPLHSSIHTSSTSSLSTMANQNASYEKFKAVADERNIKKRLKRLEALAPTLTSLAAKRIDEDSKKINTFFEEELPAAYAEIQKLKSQEGGHHTE